MKEEGAAPFQPSCSGERRPEPEKAVGVTLNSGCQGRDSAVDQPPSADSFLPLAGLGLQELYPEAESDSVNKSKISDVRGSFLDCE